MLERWRQSALAATLALAMAVPAVANAAQADETMAPHAASSFSDKQRSEIGQIVHDYLLEHPEVLLDAMQALQDKQAADAKAQAAEVIQAKPKELFHDGYSFVAGNPHAKVTVVEFFDYNCAYCRKANPKIMQLAKPNSPVKLIFKEYPVLSADSEVAARAAMAAAKQGKYLAFHKALMSYNGRANEAAIETVAKKIGLNLAELKSDMKNPLYQARIEENVKLGDDLQIDGTPSFIVGKELMAGWSESDLDKLIKKEAKGS
jgi:protein-disulfide isomerase